MTTQPVVRLRGGVADVTRRLFTKAASIGVLVVFAVMALYPIFFTAINSLKTNTAFARDPLGLPVRITFSNYTDALSRINLGRLFVNSLITTVGGVVLTTVAALFAAYAVSKLRFPGRAAVFLLVISMLVIPSQAIIYPLYTTIHKLGLLNQYLGLILAYAAFGLPLGTYLLSAYFQSVPDEIIEAARIDGAGHISIIFRVLTPISIPALASLSILNFVWMWNDLILPLVIMGGGPNKTLMVGVALLMGQYNISIPLISAGLIIALAPVLIVYLVFQRQLIRGALSGTVR